MSATRSQNEYANYPSAVQRFVSEGVGFEPDKTSVRTVSSVDEAWLRRCQSTKGGALGALVSRLKPVFFGGARFSEERTMDDFVLSFVKEYDVFQARRFLDSERLHEGIRGFYDPTSKLVAVRPAGESGQRRREIDDVVTDLLTLVYLLVRDEGNEPKDVVARDLDDFFEAACDVDDMDPLWVDEAKRRLEDVALRPESLNVYLRVGSSGYSVVPASSRPGCLELVPDLPGSLYNHACLDALQKSGRLGEVVRFLKEHAAEGVDPLDRRNTAFPAIGNHSFLKATLSLYGLMLHDLRTMKDLARSFRGSGRSEDEVVSADVLAEGEDGMVDEETWASFGPRGPSHGFLVRVVDGAVAQGFDADALGKIAAFVRRERAQSGGAASSEACSQGAMVQSYLVARGRLHRIASVVVPPREGASQEQTVLNALVLLKGIVFRSFGWSEGDGQKKQARIPRDDPSFSFLGHLMVSLIEEPGPSKEVYNHLALDLFDEACGGKEAEGASIMWAMPYERPLLSGNRFRSAVPEDGFSSAFFAVDLGGGCCKDELHSGGLLGTATTILCGDALSLTRELSRRATVWKWALCGKKIGERNERFDCSVDEARSACLDFVKFVHLSRPSLCGPEDGGRFEKRVSDKITEVLSDLFEEAEEGQEGPRYLFVRSKLTLLGFSVFMNALTEFVCVHGLLGDARFSGIMDVFLASDAAPLAYADPSCKAIAYPALWQMSRASDEGDPSTKRRREELDVLCAALRSSSCSSSFGSSKK